MDRVERVEVFAVPREQVWRAITQPERLSEWFGATAVELELRPGGRVAFRDAQGLVRRALVEIVEPPARLVFRWLPFIVSSDGCLQRAPGTTVELVLEELAEGTRLTVVESHLPALYETTPARPVFLQPTPPDPHDAPPRVFLER